MTDYHKVFVPFADIYRATGKDGFTNFSRDNCNPNLVVIPWYIIEELNKKDIEYRGSKGNEATRFIAQLGPGERHNNYTLHHYGSNLDIAIVDENSKEYSSEFDNMIEKEWQNIPEIITNSDIEFIKYQRMGMKVSRPQFLMVNSDIVNEGIIDGNSQLFAALQENDRHISLENAIEIMGREKENLFINQFIRWNDMYARVTADMIWNKNHTRIVNTVNSRVELLKPDERSMKIRIGNHVREDVFGIKPRDMEQYLAMQYGLFNPDVSLFFLCGSQGSGKTLLSYVSAIDLICGFTGELRKRRGMVEDERGFYKQMLLLKPNDILGGERRNVGYLPGTLWDKIRPHLAPYEDAHKESEFGFNFVEMLSHPEYDNDIGQRRSPSLRNPIYNDGILPQAMEAVEFTYSGFMRGRSFDNVLMVIDEAQNFTPYEIKSMIERTGENSKIIVMGDPYQYDNPLCSLESNGLTHAINHYLPRPYSALVSLSSNYRSQMSDDSRQWKTYNP